MIRLPRMASILRLWTPLLIIGLLVIINKNHVPGLPIVNDDANIVSSSSFRRKIGNLNDPPSLDASITDLTKRLLSCTNGTCRQEPQTKVAVVTYMRSGSTLTGDILSAHPDVFYVFEPIHDIAKEGNVWFNFLLTRQIRAVRKPVLMRRYMGHLFNCDFQYLDLGTLTQYHMRSSSKTKPYSDCLNTKPGIFGLIQCLPSLIKTCNSAKVIISKTIALPMQVARAVVNNDPEVKLIYLVRDPRATIFSHAKFGLYKRTEFSRYVQYFCRKLHTDILTVKAIKKVYPDSVRVVLYEQLAHEPLEISALLYQFIGLEMTSGVRAHVRNITMSGFEGKGPMTVSKANSSLTSQLWRLSMPYASARQIDKSCFIAYKHLGYNSIERREDFTDLSVSLYSAPNI